MAPRGRFGTNWEQIGGANGTIRCGTTDRGHEISVSDTETPIRADARGSAGMRGDARLTRTGTGTPPRIGAHPCGTVRIPAHPGFGTNWEHGRAGGTGRRGGFKIRWARPCGFESRARHTASANTRRRWDGGWAASRDARRGIAGKCPCAGPLRGRRP